MNIFRVLMCGSLCAAALSFGPRQVLAQQPVAALILEARRQLDELNPDSAGSILVRVLDPSAGASRAERVRALVLLGIAELMLSDPDEARRNFQQALALDPQLRVDSLADLQTFLLTTFEAARLSAARGAAPSDTRAVELYQRACDGGDMQGCMILGAKYEGGLGVARSETRAVELYEWACDRGAMQGCMVLGAKYEGGRGVAQSDTRAAELFQRACEGGEMRGCVNLGEIYEGGRGVAQSDTRAAELFQRACDGGVMEGCVLLGAKYEGGRGVARDRARAVDLYRRACDGGVSWACDQLGRSPPRVRP